MARLLTRKSTPMISEKLRPMWVWLLINAVTLIIYVGIEHWVLAPRPEGYELNVFDIWFYWITRLLPVLIIATIVNVTWLVKLLRGSAPDRIAQLRFWLATGLVWCLAILYNGLTTKIAKVAILIIADKIRR
jgi:hypothetical protein